MFPLGPGARVSAVDLGRRHSAPNEAIMPVSQSPENTLDLQIRGGKTLASLISQLLAEAAHEYGGASIREQ